MLCILLILLLLLLFNGNIYYDLLRSYKILYRRKYQTKWHYQSYKEKQNIQINIKRNIIYAQFVLLVNHWKKAKKKEKKKKLIHDDNETQIIVAQSKAKQSKQTKKECNE